MGHAACSIYMAFFVFTKLACRFAAQAQNVQTKVWGPYVTDWWRNAGDIFAAVDMVFAKIFTMFVEWFS
jgi:hypothetical protein